MSLDSLAQTSSETRVLLVASKHEVSGRSRDRLNMLSKMLTRPVPCSADQWGWPRKIIPVRVLRSGMWL